MISTRRRIEWEWLNEGREEELFHLMHNGNLLNFINMEMIENAGETDVVCEIAAHTTKGCQGILVFNNEEASAALEGNIPYIYYVDGTIRKYEQFLFSAEGAISREFNPHVMTKVFSRKYYYGEINDEVKENIIKDSNRLVTISPKDGRVFRGEHNLISQSSMDNMYIQKLLAYLKKYVVENSNSPMIIKAWQFVDIIYNNYVSKYDLRSEKATPIYYDYPCICLPNEEVLVFEDIDKSYDMGDLLVGVLMSIKRVMGRAIPTGSHNKYFRPLFDPMEYIHAEEYEYDGKKYIDFLQLTGIEFFDLNKYSSIYHDISSVKIYFETYVNGYDYTYNFLDCSNPNGADIVLNKMPYRNVLLYVNEEKIVKEKTIQCFNDLRKREYGY